MICMDIIALQNFGTLKLKYFLPAKFIIGRFACWKEKVKHDDKKNIRLSDEVNVIAPLPSKSIASI